MGILKEILKELIVTRRELQAIRSNLEYERHIPEDSNGKRYVRGKADINHEAI